MDIITEVNMEFQNKIMISIINREIGNLLYDWRKNTNCNISIANDKHFNGLCLQCARLRKKGEFVESLSSNLVSAEEFLKKNKMLHAIEISELCNDFLYINEFDVSLHISYYALQKLENMKDIASSNQSYSSTIEQYIKKINTKISLVAKFSRLISNDRFDEIELCLKELSKYSDYNFFKTRDELVRENKFIHRTAKDFSISLII